ncbi:cyclase family protein [Methanoculleus sp. FWC-SCC1]|uniref:Cyclase family protein n=1 Tax=Methanoculleus frigidifontis TaxID=2584085 RepID=A0ABT8M7P2_9EURY|nr:cyclase family protein [Methanoculleus sp. FWC-SCC1]MDN7023953.1 cyclase family protein [Methanoculleus sp. FWC-SCC1]
MLIPISYPLNRQAPLYPGSPPITIREQTSIADGDPETTSIITLSSHAGTHIDLPKHVCTGGGSVADLLAPEPVFAPAYCIDVPTEGAVPLRAADLAPHLPAVRDGKALFVRTGASSLRDINPDVYASAHPWVHPDVPALLRTECPDLHVFGIDTISIASPAHPEESRATHAGFLCTTPRIFVMEDVDLSYGRLIDEAWILRLYPVLFDDIEGVPVVALAEIPGA